LHLIYPPERLTSELLERAEPAAEIAPAPAFTVLVCVAQDRSGPGLVLLASAFSRAPSRLYALGMVPMTERGSAYIDSSPDQQGTDTLAPLMARAHELDLDVKPLSFVSADPGRDICDVAQVKGADLVLLDYRLVGVDLAWQAWGVDAQGRIGTSNLLLCNLGQSALAGTAMFSNFQFGPVSVVDAVISGGAEIGFVHARFFTSEVSDSRRPNFLPFKRCKQLNVGQAAARQWARSQRLQIGQHCV
jgi:hypothetical protein